MIMNKKMKKKNVFWSVLFEWVNFCYRNVAFNRITCFLHILLYYSFSHLYLHSTYCVLLFFVWGIHEISLKQPNSSFLFKHSIQVDLAQLWWCLLAIPFASYAIVRSIHIKCSYILCSHRYLQNMMNFDVSKRKIQSICSTQIDIASRKW